MKMTTVSARVFSDVGKNTGREKKNYSKPKCNGKMEELWSITNMFTMCSRAVLKNYWFKTM